MTGTRSLRLAYPSIRAPFGACLKKEEGHAEDRITFKSDHAANIDEDRCCGRGHFRYSRDRPSNCDRPANETGCRLQFSFAACGDTRPMMYLPYKDGQPDLVKMFVEMFGLVMPEKVAEEVVSKDVKMTFDPVTKELIQVVMPFMTRAKSRR